MRRLVSVEVPVCDHFGRTTGFKKLGKKWVEDDDDEGCVVHQPTPIKRQIDTQEDKGRPANPPSAIPNVKRPADNNRQQSGKYVRTAEIRRKQSLAMLGHPSPRKGAKLSGEAKQKLREKALLRFADPQRRQELLKTLEHARQCKRTQKEPNASAQTAQGAPPSQTASPSKEDAPAT